jgi:protein ImuB
VPEVIHPQRPAPETFAVYPFEYASERMDVLHMAIDHLAERIHSVLQNRNRGARQIECWLYHETAEPRRIEAALFRSSRSAKHLRMLLRLQLERIQLPEPVTAICLRVTEAELLSDTQAEFFDTQRLNEEKALTDLIDQLSGRLGCGAVTRPALVPDPQPEYAYRFEPLIQVRDVRAEAVKERTVKKRRPKPLPYDHGSEKLPNRPLRFWPTPLPVEVMSVVPDGPPMRLRWAKQDYRIIRTWGPERIETGWWRGGDVHRDYYIVATHTGARFWLFRRHEDGRWFVQGCYE